MDDRWWSGGLAQEGAVGEKERKEEKEGKRKEKKEEGRRLPRERKKKKRACAPHVTSPKLEKFHFRPPKFFMTSKIFIQKFSTTK